MGAFVLFPVLLFSVFITSVLGVFDYVHVAILAQVSIPTKELPAQRLSPSG